MNTYATLQQYLVADRQQAFQNEARDARLLATASPLPAVSAGSRAAADASQTWPADGEPIAVQPRSLGAAAAPPRAATLGQRGSSTSAQGCSPCADERTH